MKTPRWLLALAFYLLLGIALTWPLATRFASDLPGGAHKDGLEDAYQNVWNLWWTVEALSRPANLWVSDRFFYPEQPNLLFHTLSPANTLLAAPVTALWGPIAGFNAVALVSFALGGLGMWQLARGRAGDGPALLAGIVYAASPFHMAALVTDGQLQIFAFQWLPWYVYYLLRVLNGGVASSFNEEKEDSFGGRRPPQPPLDSLGRAASPKRERGFFGGLRPPPDSLGRPASPKRERGFFEGLRPPPDSLGRPMWRRDALLAGLFLVLVAWTDWYYTLFLLIFSAGALVWKLAKTYSARHRAQSATLQLVAPLMLPLTLVGTVFAVGAAPLVVPMLLEAARASYMSVLPADDPARLSADLLAYLVPPRGHALWGAAPWAWGVSYGVNRRFFLGLAALALAALALWRRPAARPWGIAAGGFLLLSLGSSLHVNGANTGLPLPYALLADLPIVRLTRQPDRFNVLVLIAGGVLVAHGAAALIESMNRRKHGEFENRTTETPRSLRSPRLIVLALLGGLLLLEYWPAPIVTRAPATPPFLASLPASDSGALLEYPFHDDVPYRDAERMLFQTVHGRPISGGYHSRAYPQPQLGLPALRDLRAGQLNSDIAIETGGWTAALQTLGYRYIIGYKQQPLGPLNLQPADEAPFRALVEAGLGVAKPSYEDAWLIAYEVPAATPAPVVQLREGWGALEEPEPGRRYRWLPVSAELGVFAPAAGVYRLSFTATPAGDARTLRLELPGQQLDLALTPGARRYSLVLELPAGRSVARLHTLEPPTSGEALEGNGDTRPLSARFSAIGLDFIGQN